jgi:hypothetical protein
MVDYVKAFKTPFLDVKKLFASTFILLLFFIIIFVFIVLISIFYLRLSGLNTTIPVWFNLLLYSIIALIETIPFAFFLRYGSSVAKNNFIVPSWKDIKGLFNDGIKIIGLYIIYAIPLYILNFLILGPSAFSTNLNPQDAISIDIIMKIPLFLVIIIPISLLYSYMIPVVLLRFMETKKFKDGFDFSTILRKAFNAKYLVAWIVSFLMMVVACFFAFLIILLLFITLIGIPFIVIAMPMFVYILSMFLFGIYGQAYREVK